MRIVHEASLYDDNCFVTLTYRDKELCDDYQLKQAHHVPLDGSLNKAHFQKFMKRLRKHYLGGKEPLRRRPIRYYQCGEYGEQLLRPHHHACLFNLDFEDKQLFKTSEGIHLYTSATLEKLWPYGFSTVGELTFESAAYTARYVMKKVTGQQADDHYLRWDEDGVCYWLEPEYTTMSRRPGIARDWYEQFKDDLFPSDEVPVPGAGVFKKVPRYYEELLRRESETVYEEIKRLRRVFRAAHGDEYTPERLMDKYKVKKAQLTTLHRDTI